MHRYIFAVFAILATLSLLLFAGGDLAMADPEPEPLLGLGLFRGRCNYDQCCVRLRRNRCCRGFRTAGGCAAGPAGGGGGRRPRV